MMSRGAEEVTVGIAATGRTTMINTGMFDCNSRYCGHAFSGQYLNENEILSTGGLYSNFAFTVFI